MFRPIVRRQELLNHLLSGNVPGSRRGTPRIAAGASMGKDGRDAERVTTTLTRAQKLELDRVALREGVKVAWLVRRAVERLLDEASGGRLLPLDFGGGREDR